MIYDNMTAFGGELIFLLQNSGFKPICVKQHWKTTGFLLAFLVQNHSPIMRSSSVLRSGSLGCFYSDHGRVNVVEPVMFTTLSGRSCLLPFTTGTVTIIAGQ